MRAPSVAVRYFLPAAVLLLAFALRVIALPHLPPGLSHDEAYNGIAALDVMHGHYRIFYEINKGIEPLIIWLEGWAFQLWGVGPTQLRLVNVLAGLLTVALVYPLTARLFNRRIALLAMTGVAVSFWAIFVSRLTLRAVLLPPGLLLTLYFLWLALKPNSPANRVTSIAPPAPPKGGEKSKIPPSGGIGGPDPHSPFTPIWFSLTGLFAGITMYTYLSARFVPLIVLAMFGYQWFRGRIGKHHWLGLALFVLVWGLIFSPLAAYYWQNAESFSRRADQVSTIPYALNGDFGPMLRHTLRTLGMFTLQGDTTDRYNLDGRPVFDHFNALFFYLGLWLMLRQLYRAPRRAPAEFLLLSTAFFMLLPGFITDDSPHFLRTIGAMPVAYIIWALGLFTVAGGVGRSVSRRVSRSAAYRFAIGLMVGMVLLTLSLTFIDYFRRWPASADARLIYGADIAEVAAYLQNSTDEGLPVISSEYYRDLDRFRFNLHFGGRPPFALWFDGRQSLAFPPPGSDLSPRYIFPASAPAPAEWLTLLQPAPESSGREYTLSRKPTAAAIAHLQAEAAPLAVKVNDDVQIIGYRVLDEVVTGGQFRLLLLWQALRALPPGTDYTFVAQLRDTQGHLWAQVDGLGYDPADWQPGIIGLQLLTFRLPGDLPPRAFQLVAQVVNRQSGQALPTAAGSPDIPLGAVTARLDAHPPQVDPANLPNPTDQPAGETGLTLRGYALNRVALSPGDALQVTLHWQVAQPPAQDYRLEFALLDAAGQPTYRWPPLDPVGGEWPTSQWPAAYWVRDSLTLPLPALPPGDYALVGTWVPGENRFDLQTITIEAK